MQNHNIEDQWKLYEYATEMANMGILMDFLKSSINQLYEHKAKKENIPISEIKLFEEKFKDFNIKIESLIESLLTT